MQLAGTNGSIFKTYDYDSFGNEREMAGQDAVLDSNPFRYCGEYFDKETGTIYLRARYYSPVLGRFRTEDPIRDGANWCIYAGDNPLFYVDPFGLELMPIRKFVGWFGGSVSTDDIYRVTTFTINGQELLSTYSGYNVYGLEITNEGGSLKADHVALYNFFGKALGIPSIEEEGLKPDPAFDIAIGVVSGGIAAGGRAVVGAIVSSPTAATIAGSGAAAAQKIDANKINHIFNKAGRGLEPLVQRFGSQANAYNAVQNATPKIVDAQKLTGTFDSVRNPIVVNVGGYSLDVGGTVIDGVLRIGTFALSR